MREIQTWTRDTCETAEHLLRKLFSRDDENGDNEIRTNIRRVANETRGREARDRDFSNSKIHRTIRWMNLKKVSGWNGVTSDVLQRVYELNRRIFHKVCNACFEQGVFPKY